MIKKFDEYYKYKELSESLVQTEISKAGKGVFKSFLKTLTALGYKDISQDYKHSKDGFIAYFEQEEVSSFEARTIFKRFKSLTQYIGLIDGSKDKLKMYFGIKNSAKLEYGISYEDKLLPIGSFKLSNSTIKWILGLDSKSSSSFKKLIVNISYNDLLTFGRIKEDMKDYKPGFYSKRSYPTISDNVITFGYKGFGEWINGNFSDEQLNELKSNLKKWMSNKKWKSKVMIKLDTSNFWINIHFKTKK